MKYMDIPNKMVTMSVGDIRMVFDDKGMFDTKVFLKNFEETVLIPRLNIHFKQVEEVEEIPFVPENKTIDYTDRAELLKLAKELDVEGRIATMKTTELAEKVKKALKEGDS